MRKRKILGKIYPIWVKNDFRAVFYMKFNVSIFLFAVFFIFGSCKSGSRLTGNRLLLAETIQMESIFQENYSGIYFMDAETGEVLYNQNGDKRFIPASNVKILTLLAGLEVLRDSIPILKYQIKGDSLFFWGTGFPGFANDNLEKNANTFLFDFFKKYPDKILVFSDGNFQDNRFGSGWAWDDYFYGFQTEKTALPLYENKIHIKTDYRKRITVTPKFYNTKLFPNPDIKGSRIYRKEHSNLFEYHPDLIQSNYQTQRPVIYHQSDWVALLSQLLNRPVIADPINRPTNENTNSIFIDNMDEIYQIMMQESDNFLAEQILLNIGDKINNNLNTKNTIKKLSTNNFSPINDEIRWVDGSGLSRYNLMTPQSIAWTLRELYKNAPSTSALFDLFPQAGKSGSLKNWYKDIEGTPPLIFAKTGSMSGVYCLSGFLKTQDGRTLIFSVMNNGFVGSAGRYREALERVLNIHHK